MSARPRVVLGLPAYNHIQHIDEALETLLGQRYGDYAIVAVDDHSEDGTYDRLVHYARRDSRLIHVSQNPHRLGMIGNFNRTLTLARALRPDAEFFAWVSDHDIWHPYWLESLIAELEADPLAVLAYPIYLKVSEQGKPLGIGGWRFETSRSFDRRQRFRTVMRSMSPGNMIYGLFRVATLQKAGGQRRTLLPDRLLIAETSLYGRFRQVPEILWYRRHRRGRFSIERQRGSLFGPQRPSWARVPWSLTHPCALFWSLGVRGAGCPEIGRMAGWTYAVESLVIGLFLHLSQSWRRFRKRHVSRLLERRSRQSGPSTG